MRFVAFALAIAFTLPGFAQDKPDETLTAVVGVSAKIQQNARSAESLGLQRRGTGALIREGYVLTIGYLVIEAESIQVTSAEKTARAIGLALPQSILVRADRVIE